MSTPIPTWLELAPRAKSVRQINEDWYGKASEVLRSSGLLMQFDRDVKVYNLYEAVLMVTDDDKRFELEDVFARLLTATVSSASVLELPSSREMNSINAKGEFKPVSISRTLRPYSVWMLCETHIRDIEVCTAVAGSRQLQERVRRVLETALPPNISETHCRDAVSRGLWKAVSDVPIAYREPLCARFIKMFDIPPPPEPKSAKPNKPFFAPNPREIEKFSVFVIDSSGGCWTWNCGWYRIDEKGDRLEPRKQALGHSTFRRVITPASPEDFLGTSFRYTRPWGHWRKGNGRAAHTLWGNGEIELTDGLHAVVKFDDGVKREVVLANLTTVGVRSARQAPPPRKGTRKVREKSVKSKVGSMSLEDILSMLK